MKRTLLASIVAATLFPMVSFAADLGVRPAPLVVPAPVVTTWTGCYIGGNLGGAFGRASMDGPGMSVSSDRSAFVGGGQAGCDYQFAQGWVIGIRDVFDGTSNSRSGTIATGPLAGDVVNFKNQWFDTLTGRIGYSWIPSWLVYFQGGAAWTHADANVTLNGVRIAEASRTRTGWTIGGGFEWMFAPHWSVFLEGNYLDFGSDSGTVFTRVGTFCAPGCAFSARATATDVLAGVNWRFY